MKRIFILTLAFMMLGGTMAYAKTELEKIKLKVNGEEIEFEIEEQKYEGETEYKADPEIIMRFPEDFDGEEEKLYFRVKWETQTAEEIDYDDDYYIKPKIFSFVLPEATGEEQEISLKLKFSKQEYTEDTTYSLWLVGGDDYDDNFLEGKKDVLLKDDMVVFDVPEVQTTTEVLLTVGNDTIQYNGEQKKLQEALVFNEKGRLMIAVKDVAMVMEGKLADHLQWNKVSRTVTLKVNEKIFSMSEGKLSWLCQGKEMQAETVPEIKNGVMYLPLREVAHVFRMDELTWDGSTQTVRLYRSAY